jgi:hypothetical protein
MYSDAFAQSLKGLHQLRVLNAQVHPDAGSPASWRSRPGCAETQGRRRGGGHVGGRGRYVARRRRGASRGRGRPERHRAVAQPSPAAPDHHSHGDDGAARAGRLTETIVKTIEQPGNGAADAVAAAFDRDWHRNGRTREVGTNEAW